MKIGKKMLNAKLECFMIGPYAHPHELSNFLYIYIYIYIDIDCVVKYLKIDILCLFHCWQSVGTK